ncbi:MAG: hypothetical protein Q7S22_00680 [Candidatus Micrarchaeota archaeon]|nr:hypothetical protein [Candidatus Micrarchaeota archaeon]
MNYIISRGQITIEFLLNFAIWFFALILVTLSLITLTEKENDAGLVIHGKITLNEFTNVLEHSYLNKNRETFLLSKDYQSYHVGTEITKDFNGKVLTYKTIYGVEQIESEPI